MNKHEADELTFKQPVQQQWLEFSCSPGFLDWLALEQVSLAFTTYQAGKLFLLGRNVEGKLSVVERTFSRCMGLCGDSQTLWMGSLCQIWRLENALGSEEHYQGYDRLYVPRVGHTTGDLDVHDVAIDANGRLIFVNTRFGCLATLSQSASFTPLWKPPHLSQLVPEDRCHLNGLAMREGHPAYVTCVSQSDVLDGWRDLRKDGGCVLDVPSGRVVASQLSMPHSPRVYRDQLWVLNSGRGEFGRVDLERGEFVPQAFCPGYLRGLAFSGDYAIVGVSQPRNNKTFSGLELETLLAEKNLAARCGLLVIDLRTGQILHWIWIEGEVTELYDIVALPGVIRPMAMGFKSDEIQRLLTMGESEEL